MHYADLFKAAGITSLSAENNGFAMAFGGGVDVKVGRHPALRPAQFDYLMTRYEWKPIGINNQKQFPLPGWRGVCLWWLLLSSVGPNPETGSRI